MQKCKYSGFGARQTWQVMRMPKQKASRTVAPRRRLFVWASNEKDALLRLVRINKATPKAKVEEKVNKAIPGDNK